MLNLRSELRRKLLAFLFAHMRESFYVRELARTLAVDPTNLSRELRALERQGVLVSELRGQARYYRLNARYRAFRELKGMVAKTVGVVGMLQDAFRTMREVQLALLYGSFAKGREDEASDIDVLVVGNPPSERLADAVAVLEKRLGREINVTTYAPNEFARKRRGNDPLLKSIFHDAYVLLAGNL